MSHARHSFVAFYPSDWLGGTARMTRIQRSVYFDVCCYNWDTAQECPPADQALMLGDVDGWQAIVELLITAGKLYRTPTGALGNPKAMAVAQRAYELWERKSEGGKLTASKNDKNRGAPSTPDSSPRKNGPLAASSAASSMGGELPENLNHNHNLPVSTAPSAPAPKLAPQDEIILPPITPSPDARTWLFNEGLFAVHSATGKTGAQLRPVFGKWLKALADDPAQLRAVIEEAERRQPADWLTWLHGAVKVRVPSSLQPDDVERIFNWRLKLYGWRRHGIWAPDAGDNPDQPDCGAPKSILAEWPPLGRDQDRKKLRMPLKDDPAPAGWAP